MKRKKILFGILIAAMLLSIAVSYGQEVKVGDGKYFIGNAPPAKCPGASCTLGTCVTPQTYVAPNGKGPRGPYVTQNVAGMLGTSKTWTPMGAWNNDSTAVYPLPITISTVNAGDMGLKFSYPPVFANGFKYEPSKLKPPPEPAPPPLELKGDANNDFILVPMDASETKGQYALASASEPDKKVTAVDGFSDWAASVTLYASNNPQGKNTFDINFTFADGSPLVYLNFNAPKVFFRFPAMAGVSNKRFYPSYQENPSDSLSGEVVGYLMSNCATIDRPNPSAPVNCTDTFSPSTGKYSISGQVKTLSGGLAGAKVEAWKAKDGTGRTSATTDASGNYTLSNLDDDRWIVFPSLANHCFTPAQDMVCTKGQNVSGVNFDDSFPFYHGYAFIAPPNSAWKANAGSELTLTFPDETQRWLIVMLMPDLPEGTDHDQGAATVLQAYLTSMLDYAYGIPRQTETSGKDKGTGTQVDWSFNDETQIVTTNLTYHLSSPPNKTQKGTLYGLFPHQWRNVRGNTHTATFLTYNNNPLEYTTVMGKMKLAYGNGFSTSMKFPGVLPEVPAAAPGSSFDTLNVAGKPTNFKTILEDEAKDPPRDTLNTGGHCSVNTYDTGKIFGLRASLLQVSNQLNDKTAQQTAMQKLKDQLTAWLSGGKIGDYQSFIYYNDRWGAFVGYPSAYFADALLNDLHFHYGYWLRAAAEIARTDAFNSFLPSYGPMINLLLKTIANPKRNEERCSGAQCTSTPFLRYFSPYHGHCWASGLPLNSLNQESSSEAMNAWTGIILWGQMWGQAQNPRDYTYRDLGIWMYTNELNSIYNYWFDVYKGNFSDRYKTQGSSETAATPLTFASIVNGSYLELTSNFGMHPDYLAGINWLPFHGGSFYLSSNDPTLNQALQGQWDWTAANQKKLTAKDPTPSIWDAGWAEVMSNFEAMLGPAQAGSAEADFLDYTANPNRNPYGVPMTGESTSYSYYWIKNLEEIGVRNEDISADWPFAMAFINAHTNKKWYVAWNPGNKPLTVTFSDGTKIETITADEVRAISK